jgi:hypothetical protein
MSQSRGVKIDVHLYDACCCHSACTHTAALVTDLATGRKFIVEYNIAKIETYEAKIETLYDRELKEYSPYTATLYSKNNFDEFVNLYKNKFGNPDKYNFFINNCADAVKFTIDHFCPSGQTIDAFCSAYKILCCWGFLGSLGMRCFPSIFCTVPSDTFNLALLLSQTNYGKLPENVLQDIPQATLDCPQHSPLLSAADKRSVSLLTRSTSASFHASSVSPLPADEIKDSKENSSLSLLRS